MFEKQSPAPAPAQLQTLSRIPSNNALPLIPALQKTVKPATVIPKAVEASPALQTKPPEGFNPPTLEKVTRAPVVHPGHPSDLRPSWPTAIGSSDKVETGITTAPRQRFEDPHGVYLITTEVHALTAGSAGSDGPVRPRQIVNSILTYDRVMRMFGTDVTKKLIEFALERVIPESLPPFLKTGIGLGTAEMIVQYPTASQTLDLVATINIKRAASGNGTVPDNVQDAKYRTITIRRVRPDMITAFEL